MNQRTQSTHLASVLAFFCLCLQKASVMYEKSGVFNSKSILMYRTRTIAKKAYRTNVPYPYHNKKNVPYFLAKTEAYRTVPTLRTAILASMPFIGWLERTKNLVVLKLNRTTYTGNFFFYSR